MTPDTPSIHQRQSVNGCVTCERRWDQHTDAEKASRAIRPDTTSTEALTPDDRLRAMLWEAAVVGSSQGVLPASLRRRFDEALTERAVRQEAADTSGHRLIFAAASAVNSEPMLYCSCGAWQWTAHVRDVDLSHFRSQEATDTSGLRAAAQYVDDGWHVVDGDEGREQVRLRYASDLPARLNTLRAALRGATERPLDLGDKIGRAMHEASQVGGPWTPCPFPYNQWPDCEHQPMGQHVATIVLGIDNA